MVYSLKPEYDGKIRFLVADLSTREGRWFAEYHNANRVTLLFFSRDGTIISSLEGVQESDYLRRLFNRVFNLE